MTRAIKVLCVLVFCSSASYCEPLFGELLYLDIHGLNGFAANTLYGKAVDQGNPTDNTHNVNICWSNTLDRYENWQSTITLTLGQKIIDNALHVQQVSTAGTVGTSTPTFNDSGGTTSDGSVVWQDEGLLNCDTPVVANTLNAPINNACAVPGTAGCHGYLYHIPVGSVGPITPMDGSRHYLTICVASQGGGPCYAVNGSPWPFKWTSGTVDTMWDPAPSPPSRMTASQFGIIANSDNTKSVGSAGTTVCTIGATAIKDDGIAGIYQKLYGIPCGNIKVVSLGVGSENSASLTDAQWTSNIGVALAAMPSTVQFIGLAWARPSVITYTGTGVSGFNGSRSIAAVTAYNGWMTGNRCDGVGTAGMGQGPANPYFNSSSVTPYTDFGFRPTMLLGAMNCAGCTATTNTSGTTWTTDVAMSSAVAVAGYNATNTNPLGKVYVAITTDDGTNGANGRSQIWNSVSKLSTGTIITSKITDFNFVGSTTSPHSESVDSQNITLYMNGSSNFVYNVSRTTATFLPGAGLMSDLTSDTGNTSQTTQTMLPAAFETGTFGLNAPAVASAGQAVEPCSINTQKNVDPALVTNFYVKQGRTAIEALWSSVEFFGQWQVFGNPFAAPFTFAGPNVSGSSNLGGAAQLIGQGVIK